MEPLKFGFSLPKEKQLVTALRGVTPIGVFPVGVSFLVVGTTKGLVLIGSKTLRVFRGAFLRRKCSPSFTS